MGLERTLNWLFPVTFPLSYLYRLGIYLRNQAYDQEKKEVTKVKPIVLSIGNIVTGGTGKTPWTLKIAKDLTEKGVKLGVLSRGYRSLFEHQKTPVLICDQKGPLYPPESCGDEPYLICQNLPEISFYVGKNRVLSAKMAEEKKLSLVLLDDGMQHRRLKRDFECTLIDAREPLKESLFLPLGRLRDSPNSLRRSDLILINHVQSSMDLQKIEEDVRAYTKAPIVYTQFKSLGFYNLKNEIVRIDSKMKVAAFCGLGRPNGFYAQLQKEGCEILIKRNLKDHGYFESKDLKEWAKKALELGAHALICTEKDAVKFNKNLRLVLPIYYLKVEPVILKGAENYQGFLKKVVEMTPISY